MMIILRCLLVLFTAMAAMIVYLNKRKQNKKYRIIETPEKTTLINLTNYY